MIVFYYSKNCVFLDYKETQKTKKNSFTPQTTQRGPHYPLLYKKTFLLNKRMSNYALIGEPGHGKTFLAKNLI